MELTKHELIAHIRSESTTRLHRLRNIYAPTTQAHGLIIEEITRRQERNRAARTTSLSA